MRKTHRLGDGLKVTRNIHFIVGDVHRVVHAGEGVRLRSVFWRVQDGKRVIQSRMIQSRMSEEDREQGRNERVALSPSKFMR